MSLNESIVDNAPSNGSSFAEAAADRNSVNSGRTWQRRRYSIRAPVIRSESRTTRYGRRLMWGIERGL
jgi:hypothetical protein